MSDLEAPEGLHPVLVDLTIAPTLNFAMEQSGVPLVSGVRVQNLGAETLTGATLEVRLEPDLGDATVVALDPVRGGEDAYVPVVDVRLPPGRLRGVVEAEKARLAWTLRRGAATLASGDADIEVLAFNEWPGLRAPPALLATFVMPNHPVVAQLLRRVRDRLRADTGDDSISGYQTRSPRRVIQTLAALVRALQDLGVSYVGVPASFEAMGQKVRLPDMVLGDGMGNCLDVTVLLAACMEQMGLAPLLVVVKGHAFPAVWLVDERFPEGVVHDPARLRTLSTLGQLLAFDSSTCVRTEHPSLDEAVATATEILARDDAFVFAVDVRVVRLDRYRPLPLRMTTRIEGNEAPTPARSILAEALRDPEPTVHAATPPPPPEPVVARFERWKQRLLDLSLHNRLLNYRVGGKTSLRLLVPDLPRFEDLLAGDAVFEVHPRPDADVRDRRDEELAKARADEAELVERRRQDLERHLLHANVDRDVLIARAVELDRAARVDREEGGANTLFAAIGMLRWYESPSSELPRHAPLLLVPVRLEYDRVRRRIRLRRTEEDAVGNVTLAEKLRRDFAVDLSGVANLETDDSGVDVPGMLRRARTAISQMSRWEVLDEVHLGLFTFTKFLMWVDLDRNADALLQSEVVRHLAAGGKAPFPDPVGEPDLTRLDDHLPPAALPTVLDSDSTQLAAVSSALRGRSFVLQGPPGTGKSQTIANLIAGALAEGKTVLFVSEKMAALDVVFRRLKDVGLGDYCLELHSNKSSKKDVVTSLGRAYGRNARVGDGDWETHSGDIAELRTKLNAYVRALHAPRPLGRTFYQASARLLALRGVPEVRLPVANPAMWTEAQWRSARQALDVLTVAAAAVEPIPDNPWRECSTTEWSSAGEEAGMDAIVDALAALDEAEVAADELGGLLGTDGEPSDALVALGAAASAGTVPPTALADTWPGDAARARAWIAAAREDRDRTADLATRWTERLDGLDVEKLQAVFQQWTRAFFVLAWIFLFFPRRSLAAVARGAVPANARILDDLGVAAQLRHTRDEHARERTWAAAVFAGAWGGDDPDALSSALERGEVWRSAVARWRATGAALPAKVSALAESGTERERAAVRAIATRARDAQAELSAARERAAAALSVPLPEGGLRTRLVDLRAAFARWRPWCLYRSAAREVEQAGLGAVVQAHRAGTVSAAQLADVAERALLTRWVAAVRDAEPALRTFDGAEQRRRVARFRELDREHIKLGRRRVLARLDSRRPAAVGGAAATSEPGILAREVARQRGHLPVRKLLASIPNLLPRIKPCLLMSPLSIAQYLPADGRRFDLVVFDEASQIGTHDAIGAIARGDQVVIVGDSRQLPPTSFFQRDAADDEVLPDENDVVELESILDEAVAARLPQQMLGWHYRSRHEALIEFSNRHYYEGRLNVFPAARGHVADLGVRWHAVPNGVYDKGATRQNRLEAESLVTWLVAALRQTAPGARTFGVVTFSVQQQTLIQDLLDEARAKTPEIEGHFADALVESVFVKNLENVQGDERDVILFSVCYGPDAAGKVWMNFGPLNRTGGERRLNVAITRARSALHVFSTLTADQIDLARTTATGARHLKAFLRYAAEHGSVTGRVPRSAPFESDFERQVHDALVGLGYEVDGQVGCGGYRIDLAVVHPERPGEYVLGVECDGATYHSAATARDRDRLRQDVLEGLGWRLHRVWSTDWWFDKERESRRLDEAVRAAIEAVDATPAPAEVPAPVVDHPVENLAPSAAVAPIPMIPYKPVSLDVVTVDTESIHLPTATGFMRARIGQLVVGEGPIALDEVCRRVAACWSAGRAGSRIRDRITREVQAMSSVVTVRGAFVWPVTVNPATMATFRGPTEAGEVRDATLIAPEEVAVAAGWVLAQSLSLDEATLARETAKLFGIRQVGVRVAERMREGVEVLVARGVARREGERVVAVEP